jgi:hypothetical protein
MTMRVSFVMGLAMVGLVLGSLGASAEGPLPPELQPVEAFAGASAGNLARAGDEGEAAGLTAGERLVASGSTQVGAVHLNLNVSQGLYELLAGDADGASHALLGPALTPTRLLEPVGIARDAAEEGAGALLVAGAQGQQDLHDLWDATVGPVYLPMPYV